jgi:hydrogenase maturation protease
VQPSAPHPALARHALPLSQAREIKILIAGVGNLLLTDDGVGIHALRELELCHLHEVELLDVGTAALSALPFLEKAARVLVLDAVRGGHPPGTLYHYELGETLEGEGYTSLHSLGLKRALQLMSPDVVPPPITVLGVEPLDLNYGLELSPAVQAALPQLVKIAVAQIEEWQMQLRKNHFLKSENLNCCTL